MKNMVKRMWKQKENSEWDEWEKDAGEMSEGD